MKKKFFVGIVAGIVMSCLLGVFAFLLDIWESNGWFRRVFSFFVLIGWGNITYNLITLKYNWIRKLAE